MENSIIKPIDYYTPEKSEFYFGCDFQVKLCDSEIWLDCTFNSVEEAKLITSIYEKNEQKDRLRFKYLQFQEIVGLGWNFMTSSLSWTSSWFSENGFLVFNYIGDKNNTEEWDEYLLNYCFKGNIKITKTTYYSILEPQTDVIFIGNCKSKNDFKQLMELHLKIK